MQTIYPHLEPETLTYNALTSKGLDQFTANTYIRAVKYASGVTFFSITARVSNVASYYFMSGPSSDILRPFSGFYATLTDTANKAKKVLLGAVGLVAGETVGSTLNVSTCVNDNVAPYETFDGASATAFHAINSAGGMGFGGTADELAITSGALYKAAFSLSLAAGTIPDTVSLGINLNNGGAVRKGPTVAGANTFYLTCNATTTGQFGIDIVGTGSGFASEFTVSSLAFAQVLTPSVDGIWYTLVSEDSGWSPNSASYTVAISRT